MALTQLAPPYPIFTDKNGDPLDSGYIYLGEANKNPETNPIQVYYDSAFTQPAAQPLRTSNGYIMRNGSPASIYAQSVFSVTVRDKSNAFVIYAPVGYSQTLEASEIVYNEGSTGAVDRTVENRLRDFASVKDFGAVGDGVANDLAEIQAAVDNGPNAISVPKGTYDLGGGTLTLPAGSSLLLDGGVLTNGTIACDGNFFFGARGLSESITLTGTVANEDGVFFDWFTCEKATKASYDTFINGNNATFGAVPSISSTNRTILLMLINNFHTVCFGGGIYPFDAELPMTGSFRISGQDRVETLLWAPNSNFFHYSGGGATYAYFRDISIETKNCVILTDAWLTNAFHGLILEKSFFISYEDHTFHNDYSTAGGTGCPIYGSKIVNCAVFAGAGKGCFYGWSSGSNIYDNVVDQFLYWGGQATRFKGIPKAIFYNSNVRKYTNSNISYAGFEYVFYWDRPSSLIFFYAFNNVFETNLNSYKAIVKVASGGSNLYISAQKNQYIGSPTDGYYYILEAGNNYVDGLDAQPAYGTSIRNRSNSQTLTHVTGLIDSGATKYRLVFREPNNVFSGPDNSVLLTANATNAALIGMSAQYAADPTNISYIQVTPSSVVDKNRALAGGFGTTAARPTALIYTGYPYFDTTLGKPIWYNGTGWVDATGASV